MTQPGIRFVATSFLLGLLTCSPVSAQQIKVDLARGFKSAIQVSPAISESPIVSIDEDRYYLDGNRVEKNRLSDKLGELIKSRSGQVKVVRVACSADAEYGTVVDVLRAIRGQEVGQVGLIVDRGNGDEVLPGMFLIEIPLPWKEGDDLSKLKPNPLTLVTSISFELQLTLNHDAGPRRGQLCFKSVPHGVGSDPTNLKYWLSCLFDNRTRQRAYKIGMETRTDLPLAKRIEKTLFVKAPRSVKYVDVLRVVDAAMEAGADPIGLQVDALSN